MKKILVIDNYDSFVYNLVQLLREVGEMPGGTGVEGVEEVEELERVKGMERVKELERVEMEVMKNDAVEWGRLGEFGGVLLSPGPGVPSEAGELLRVIERCRGTHSMLGVCLGHQAIAEAFGGRLVQLPAPLHGHRSVLRRTGVYDPLLEGLPGGMGRRPSATNPPAIQAVQGVEQGVEQRVEQGEGNGAGMGIAVGRYHSWVVDGGTLPAELLVSSVDEEGNIMSLRHRELPIFGVQFHPESYISNCGAALIANWLRTVPST